MISWYRCHSRAGWNPVFLMFMDTGIMLCGREEFCHCEERLAFRGNLF